MGGIFSSISRLLTSKQNIKIVMVGLDGAGKTTMLYKLQLGDTVDTVPTIGFNMEIVRHKNISFSIWDIGGQYKIRALWRYYYNNVNAVVFVVDASDKRPGRLNECKEELHYLINENELSKVAILIFANKQDVSGALSASEIAEKLDLLSLKHRKCFVQASSAKTGEGISEGLEWLANTFQNKGLYIPLNVYKNKKKSLNVIKSNSNP